MEVTGIITAIVIGLIIGALGRLVVPGKQTIPIWLTLVIGVVAALLGTLVASLFGVDDTSGIDWIELLIQVVFAAIGVSIVAGMYGRRRHVTSPNPMARPRSTGRAIAFSRLGGIARRCDPHLARARTPAAAPVFVPARGVAVAQPVVISSSAASR